MRSEVKSAARTRTTSSRITSRSRAPMPLRARRRALEGDRQQSANGVRVNGEEYAVSNLKPGDVIELGHLKFRFCALERSSRSGRERRRRRAEGRPQAHHRGADRRCAGAAGIGPPTGQVQDGMIGGIAAALVVIGVVGFFATRSRKPPNPEEATGADAVKQGDAFFKQHKYLAAMDMYDKAGPSPAPNKKKADRGGSRRGGVPLDARSHRRGDGTRRATSSSAAAASRPGVPEGAGARRSGEGRLRQEAPRGSHRGQVSRQARPLLAEVKQGAGIRRSNTEAQRSNRSASRGGRPGGACPARGPYPKEREERLRAWPRLRRQVMAATSRGP